MMESGMAVGSFLKSSGIAALAFGLAIALPGAASAQERGQRGGAQAHEQRSGEGRGAWQSRGGREAREARQQTRQQTRAQAQPRVQAQARPQSLWQGNRVVPGARPERRDNPSATVQQNTQRSLWRAPNSDRAQRNEVRRNEVRRDEVRRDDARRTDARRDNDRTRWSGDRNQARRDDNRWNNDNNRRWNNNWRRDNRYDWSGYRSTNRNVFRLGRYNSPYRNWNYRRLGIGFALQPLFYSSSYWINDPWSYRLPEAYGPYRWVRYYDDALLVDIRTGQVIDVIHSFFW